MLCSIFENHIIYKNGAFAQMQMQKTTRRWCWCFLV